MMAFEVDCFYGTKILTIWKRERSRVEILLAYIGSHVFV